MSPFPFTVATLLAVLATGSCSRNSASENPPPPARPPAAPILAAPPSALPGVAVQAPTAPQGLQPARPAGPAGPRDDETADNYVLSAVLAPATAPADTTFTLELHGTGGYHVNEQYPIQVDLEVQHATTAKSTLRRADAATYEQSGARFALPVHTTGPGAIVRGRARFAVCSAENCVPETREFAVGLP